MSDSYFFLRVCWPLRSHAGLGDPLQDQSIVLQDVRCRLISFVHKAPNFLIDLLRSFLAEVAMLADLAAQEDLLFFLTEGHRPQRGHAGLADHLARHMICSSALRMESHRRDRSRLSADQMGNGGLVGTMRTRSPCPQRRDKKHLLREEFNKLQAGSVCQVRLVPGNGAEILDRVHKMRSLHQSLRIVICKSLFNKIFDWGFESFRCQPTPLLQTTKNIPQNTPLYLVADLVTQLEIAFIRIIPVPIHTTASLGNFIG